MTTRSTHCFCHRSVREENMMEEWYMQSKIIQGLLLFHLVSFFHPRVMTVSSEGSSDKTEVHVHFWWEHKWFFGKNIGYQSSHTHFTHCRQAPLLQTQPEILSHSHTTMWQLEPQYPVPKPVPALTSTKHCILFNHFGDIGIRVNTEVTGALDRCKTEGKRNIKEHQHQKSTWARLTSGNLYYNSVSDAEVSPCHSPLALLHTTTAVPAGTPQHRARRSSALFIDAEC